MIKRIVILQDESLVVREMTRVGRPHAAYAVAVRRRGVGVTAPAASSAPAGAPTSRRCPTRPTMRRRAAAGRGPGAPPTGSKLADVAKAAAIKAERAIIEETLKQVHWNRRRAAEQLGVSYKTLLNKIKECGISRK